MRVLRLLLALTALVAAAPAFAQRFTAITFDWGVIDGLDKVEIRLGDHVLMAPRTEPDQAGFSDTQISPDGRYAGWVALVPNDAANYPMPGALVVMDTKQRVHRFSADSAIWDWAFVEPLDAVALLSAPMHFVSSYGFELRSIATGKMLATYACTSDPDNPDAPPPADMPEWARAVAVRADCDASEAERAEEQRQ